MSEYRVSEVIEQEGTFDGKWNLALDSYLLMKIVNHAAAESEEEIAEMKDPKRLSVRVIIETREMD